MTPRGQFVGLTTFDLIHYVESAPGPDEKVNADAVWTGAGGPATNAALAFAALGGSAILASFIGEGPLTNAVAAELQACACQHVPLLGQGVLPTSSVVVDHAGRRSVVSMNGRIDPPVAPEGLLQTGLDVVVVDSHVPSMNEVLSSVSCPVVFDPGSWKPSVPTLLDYTTHAIASHQTLPSLEPNEVVDLLLETPSVELAAVTRGSDSIVFKIRGSDLEQISVPKVGVIDTLGAGDVLHGAFALEIGRGSPIREALATAAKAAARSCTHQGPRL